MRRWEKYTLNISTALVVVSGLAYAWMKYLLVTDDPFAVVNHPWQPWMLDLHVLAAPALMLAFGIAFNSHIGRKLKGDYPNRRTGLTSLVTFAVMAVTGYLLQVVTAPLLMKAVLVLHLASGAVFAVAYGAHLFISFRLIARARTRRPAAVAA